MELKDFQKNGRISSTKAKESYVAKHYPEEYKLIVQEYSHFPSDFNFNEKLYHYLNGVVKPIFCKKCKIKKTKFQGIGSGYLDFCSSKCSNSSEVVQDKKKKSYLDKYGVDNPSKSKEVLDKISRTFEEKFGGQIFSLESFRNKIKETSRKKYGTDSPMSRGSLLRISMDKEAENEFRSKYAEFNIIDYSPDKWGTCKILCDKCLNVYEISKWNLHQRKIKSLMDNPCTICNPIGSKMDTKIELFIEDFLNQNGILYLKKDKKVLKGLEIDYFMPSKNIGIEIDGLYWHSIKFRDKKYHINKTDIAGKSGVKLIHIFEDEILNKGDLVKSRLSSILGINQYRIDARKCKIKIVSKEESRIFLEASHLSGSIGSSFNIGLIHEGNLVSLMTFGKNRKALGRNHIEGEWEMIRFCSLPGVTVIGAASRLIKYFIDEKRPQKIRTYCDIRWAPDPSFYIKLGFRLIKKCDPNYFYVKNNLMKRLDRFGFRKSVLIKKGFDPEKTEYEIMDELGYLRIYDCGSYMLEMAT